MWRLNKMGAFGSIWAIRYTYPSTPNTGISAGMHTDGVTINMAMPSGPATGGLKLFPTTRFTSSIAASGSGWNVTLNYSAPATSTAARTSNVVTLTTATPHGFAVGDVFYLSPGSVDFPPGPKLATTGTTGSTIKYTEVAADVVSGPLASTVTSAPDTPALGGIGAGDIVYINSPNISFIPQGTFRVVSASSTQIVFFSPATVSPAAMTTPQKLLVDTAIQSWPLAVTRTANDFITSASSSLSDLLTAELYAGDGTAFISVSTEDEAALGTINYNASSVAIFTFADGINFIQTSDLTASPNELTFKQGVSGTYSSAWSGEEARLVPATAESMVRWLNSPAVTGVFEQASVEVVNHDGKLQITANNPGELGGVEITETSVNGKTVEIFGVGDVTLKKVNISRAFDDTIIGNSYVALENVDKTPKSFLNITGANTIALAADGTVTFNANVSSMVDVSPTNGLTVVIHKVGDFACYIYPGLAGVLTNDVGSFLKVSLANGSSANNVTKRIVQSGEFSSAVTANSKWYYFWVENPNAISGSTVKLSGDIIQVFDPNSVMPGDEFEIGYTLGSTGNIGSFTVQTVTANSGIFKVNATFSPVTATAITTTNFNSLRLREPPTRLIKNVRTIGLDPTSSFAMDQPGTSWVLFDDGVLLNRISETLGATIRGLGRLQFDTTPLLGTNGYNVTTGLIGEVARVLYGDLNSPTVYPGVVAAGASVNISGPNIKRIQVSLQLRLRTGVSQTSVLDRVRNSVATAINSIPLGKPVDISRIVSAARSVPGVSAVSVLSPTYSSSSDVIPVQANEKPFVFDAASDINLVVVT